MSYPILTKRPHRLLCLALLLLLPAACAVAQQQESSLPRKETKRVFLFFRINKFDEEGRYHGRWKVYFGDDGQVIRNGRFRHGVEVGKWKYYYTDGTRSMKEKYNRHDNTIKVKKYHENGKLARVGQARIIRTPAETRYFWFGEWQVYDQQGQYSHTETYQSGKLISRSGSASAKR
ncbi:toxin-antitoxin system YwqK family antitoxin [Pontibacter actiniarum]|nr:hypothetical protein [Pontibacter actiniarum]